MSFTLIEVTGTYQSPEDGKPSRGTITATLAQSLRNGAAQVNSSPVLGVLNSAGELKRQDGEPFKLPATDDAGTTPAGTGYEFVVQLDNAQPRAFFAPLAHTVSPVDLSTLEPSR